MDEPHQPIEVVVLVSSAGGLEALTTVLRGLGPDLPVPVVVQQHLGGSGSVLASLLGRHAGATVEWARAGGRLRPDRVIVAPPLKRIEFFPDGTYGLHDAGAGGRGFPHDVMLRSLADSFGARALAVVLTGMGRDAAAGVRAVKQAGGVVLAQSTDTADQPSMPQAAAEAGADLVLPLHEIARVVVGVVAGQPLPRPDGEEEAVRLTFGASGEIAQLARGIDWAATPLGAVHAWPEARRVATRLAMDSAHAVALFFGDDHIVLVNEVGARSTGGDYARVFARPYAESYPEAVEYMVPVLARALAGERTYHEATLVAFEKDGRAEDSWFDMSYTPIRSGDGTALGVQQTFLDRTAEVLSRRRLRTLNRLAATAVAGNRADAVAAAVAVLAEAEDVPLAAAYLLGPVRTQASLVAACGVEPGSSIAPRLLRLQPSAVWPLQRAVEDAAEIVLDDVAGRFRGHRVGDDQLSLEQAVLHPLRSDVDGSVVGVVVLGVHPRLPLDDGYRAFLTLVGEAVAAKAHEAHARQRERDRAERLAELDRAKTEFFAGVSHEFRTPLTLMLGPLEELSHHPDDRIGDHLPDLELMTRNTRRLLRLVGTLLDFSQAEAGRLRAQFAPTDLAASTGEIASMFRSATEAAGLKLTVDAPPLPEPVWVDPEMWEKIVSNLLSNALKFTWQGGIDVSLRALAQHAELTVRDTGVGIPEEEVPHVFRRFHRVRGTRGRTHEGAGIGLALVDELVRRHRGRVRVTSEPGTGSTFTVWIPSGRRTAEPTTARPAPVGSVAATLMAEEALHWDAAREGHEAALGLDGVPVPDRGPTRRAGGAHVLVVDDNPDMRDYLGRLLRSADWQVSQAGDGEEALELIRRDRPELVLADVMMPGMDGFALLHAIRADETLIGTPVVLVTARTGEEAAVEGLLAGADDYVGKPFSARELLARVGAQLELARLRRQNERRFRAVTEASGDVVYRMSPDWTRLHAVDGKGVVADTGRPSTNWLTAYVHPDDQPAVVRAVEQAIRTESVFELEHRVHRPDGTTGWTLSRAVPLLDDDGRIIEWVGTSIDVTAQHAAPGA